MRLNRWKLLGIQWSKYSSDVAQIFYCVAYTPMSMDAIYGPHIKRQLLRYQWDISFYIWSYMYMYLQILNQFKSLFILIKASMRENLSSRHATRRDSNQFAWLHTLNNVLVAIFGKFFPGSENQWRWSDCMAAQADLLFWLTYSKASAYLLLLLLFWVFFASRHIIIVLHSISLGIQSKK